MFTQTAPGSFLRNPVTLLVVALFALALNACGAQRAATPPTAGVPTSVAPASSPTSLPTDTPVAKPTAAPAAEPTAKLQPSGLLPAPLVYNQRGQLYRLAADGVTTTQLTDEEAPSPQGVAITDFDVSPADGSLVYVVQQLSAEGQSIQVLIRANADGTGRTVLVDGAYVNTPRFSTDGAQIAFGVNPDLLNLSPVLAGGVYTIPSAGGEPQLVQASDVFDPASADGSERAYAPISWSPDGSRLLLQAFLPASEFCEVAIKELGSSEIIKPSVPEGLVSSCRGGAWSADGSTLVIALYEPGMFGAFAGLAQVDVVSGALSTPIGKQIGDSFVVINSGLLPQPDGGLLGFVATSPTPFLSEPEQPQPSFRLHAIGLDGRLTPLRDDSQLLWSAALWSVDASGAVIVSGEGTAPGQTLVWVPTNDQPAVELATGELMGQPRWGR